MNVTKNGLSVAVIVMVLIMGWTWHGAGATEAAKKGLLFNVTSGKEDLHAVTMAMQLANHALDDGREVTLFLNVRAPEFARKDLPESFAFHGNPAIKEMLTDLLSRGAKVLVCPHCAEVMGVKQADLLSGAELATRESLFGRLGSDVQVFTY